MSGDGSKGLGLTYGVSALILLCITLQSLPSLENGLNSPTRIAIKPSDTCESVSVEYLLPPAALLAMCLLSIILPLPVLEGSPLTR